MSAPAITVVTHLPSPYQVELFDAVAARGEVALSVVYLFASSRGRQWGSRPLAHDAVYLDGPSADVARAADCVSRAEVAVFNYYQHPWARRQLAARAGSGRPWIFWGERLGFRSAAWAGALYRRWSLRHLHAGRAPVWGIGRWAVESYQVEFGRGRSYQNLPYFSDLGRFASAARSRVATPGRVRFLFSGALIERKGVDLLAAALVRLAAEEPGARLALLGDGPLLPELRRRLAPCADRVEFLGFRDWEDLPAVYAQADVLCAPSRHDGWGLIVPEALAAGLPVIGTTRTGAALEFLRTGHNGWLIPAGDGAALFEAMRDAAGRSAESRAQLSRRARETVAEHTLDKGAARWSAACRSALGNWEH